MEVLTQKVILWTVVLLVLMIRVVETKFGKLDIAYGIYNFGNGTETGDLQCFQSFDDFRGDICPINPWNVPTSESTSVEAECIWMIAVWLMLKLF